jgi:hypothetical protein
MNRPPSEISFRFYAALDAISKCFDEVERTQPQLRRDCDWFRDEMERVADRVLEVAAHNGWKAAYWDSGFIDFQRDYENFVGRYLR